MLFCSITVPFVRFEQLPVFNQVINTKIPKKRKQLSCQLCNDETMNFAVFSVVLQIVVTVDLKHACLLQLHSESHRNYFSSLIFCREIGGAYGSGASHRNGVFSFFSYRYVPYIQLL